MRFCSWFISCLLFSAILTGNCRAQQVAPVALRSTGVAVGNPEQILPTGAVVHLRANNFGALLKALDEIIVTFVPEKAVPPPMQQILAQPMPVLALIGMQTVGVPITVEQLGMMLGLSLEKPITLSFYPMDPDEGFVLSLPMQNPQALTNLLQNVLAVRKFEITPSRSGDVFDITGMNPGLPGRIFVVCSDDRAYLCGSLQVAEMVAGKTALPRLDSSALIKNALQQHEKEDLTFIADPSFIKPLVSQIQNMYSRIPPPLIQGLRLKLLGSLPPNKKMRLNLRLRWQFGITDVEQGLDYVEAIASSAYEVLFSTLAAQAQALEGVVISLDAGNPTQKVRVLLHSKAIKPADWTQPVPLAEVRQALTKIPGSFDALSITGRAPSLQNSDFMAKWMENLKVKFTEKHLPSEGLARLVAQIQGYQQTQPLESMVPWTIETSLIPLVHPPTAAPRTLIEYWMNLVGQQSATAVTVMPAQKEDFIEKHFTEEAKNSNNNEKSYREYLTQTDNNQSLCSTSARCMVTSIDGLMKKVVYEKIYTSSFGVFGFSEHEFINRNIHCYKRLGDYVIMQHATSTGVVGLGEIEKTPLTPLAPALSKLLDQAPPGAVAIRTLRIANKVPAMIAGLSELEAIMHTELDDYLAQANKLIAPAGKDRQKCQALLQEIEPPLSLLSLNMDATTGELYCVLPGKLRYPRPRILPVAAGLLKDFSAQADSHGGIIEYERIVDGTYEMALAVNTDSLALLVKSTVNAFCATFVNDAAGPEKLRKILVVPGDGYQLPNEVLITNSLWDFLQDMENRGHTAPREVQRNGRLRQPRRPNDKPPTVDEMEGF